MTKPSTFKLSKKTIALQRKRLMKDRSRRIIKKIKLGQVQNLSWGTKKIRMGKDILTVDYQQLKFINLENTPLTIDQVVPLSFDNLIDSTLRSLGKDINTTKFGVDINHPSLTYSKGFFLGFRTKKTLNGTTIFNTIANIMQSNESFVIDRDFSMQVYIYEPTKTISGRGLPPDVQPRGVVRNLDNLCLARAVVMGMAEADLKHARKLKEKSRRFDMRKSKMWNNDVYCKKEAAKILRLSSISITKPSYDLKDLQNISTRFPDYHFEVYSSVSGSPQLVFSRNPDSPKKVKLFHADNHFDLVQDKTPSNLLHVISAQKTLVDGVFCDPNALMIEFNLSESDLSLDTVKTISEKYQEYNFCVYRRDLGMSKYKNIFSSNPDSSKAINIDYSNEIFAPFTPSRRKTGSTICKHCGKPYAYITTHKCPFKCTKCHAFDCPKIVDAEIMCEQCFVKFNSKKCYEKHLETNLRGVSICEKFKVCLECKAYIRLHNLHGKPHQCGKKKYCSFCRERVANRGHDCCWPPPSECEKSSLMEKQKIFKMIFYDFETVICEDPEKLRDDVEQYPNMVCYDVICHQCFLSEDETCCPSGNFSYTDYSETRWAVTDAFVDFLLYDKSNDGAIVVAHNAGKFDSHFILSRLLSKQVFPTIIKRGHNIIKMSIRDPLKKLHNNLEFKDSYALVPAALAELPKAFSIPNISKGDFPYLFNKPCNYGRVFPTHPNLEYYDVEYKTLKKKMQLEAFWHENHNKPFDFDVEILKYCQDDVKILRQAMVAYMRSNLELTGWNPLIVSNTFAGFTLHIIAFNYLKPNTLGVIHENGVFANQVQSKLALRYIQWLEHLEGVQYQHFLNHGEFEVNTLLGKFRVDAYRDGVAVEVMGCAVHACPQCFDPNKQHFRKKMTNKEVFDKTMLRVKILENMGLKVKIIWEHQIEEMLKVDKNMAKFFKACVRTHRLRPRDAFLGGRTQTYRMYAELRADQKYERLDVNSLYPYITGFWAEFPLGSPVVIVKDFKHVPEHGPFPYKGLVMIDILPPRNLAFPILGMRTGNKLLFPLCFSCAMRRSNVQVCDHTEEERKIFLTTTHVELNLALENGYKLLKIYEVWNWSRWEKGGLFAEFVKQFYKIKQESSGWPRKNMSEEEKNKYLEEIRNTTGVELEPDKIEVNGARKTCAKYMLNSSWGKFGVNINLPVTVFLRRGSDGIRKIVDSHEVLGFSEVVNDIFCINYQSKEALATQPRFTNLVISIFTTAFARNYHWQFLHEIQKELGRKAVTYADTDCVHYICKKDQNLLAKWRGNVLGKLVDETPAGWRVTRFVSPAPKTYALEMMDDNGNKKYLVKCKGITLDVAAARKINFEGMREQVLAFTAGREVKPIVTSRPMIKKSLGRISTVTVKKITRPVMDKVWFGEDYTTVPYGYDLINEEER